MNNNPSRGSPRSAVWFRAKLTDLGLSQSGLARLMIEYGDGRQMMTILRTLGRMASGNAPVSGEMRALLGTLEARVHPIDLLHPVEAPPEYAAEPEAYADRSRAERDMVRREQLADRAGFHSRQPVPMTYMHRRRKITSPEPQIPLSMRVPISIHARFLQFVERSGSTSYWDALERLMDAGGVSEDGNFTPVSDD